MLLPNAMPACQNEPGPTTDYDRIVAPAVLVFGDDPARRLWLADRATDAGTRGTVAW